MITPTIHLNGTSKNELLDQQLDAMSGVRKAVEAVQAAAPNARDYYPQGPGAFPQARQEHISRLERLNEVLKELEELAYSIANGK